MTPEQQQDFLDLLPTDVLQKALLNQFDSAVFHGLKHRPLDRKPGAHIKAWGVRGDLYQAIGLGHGIIERAQLMIENADEEATVDDL